MITSRQNLGQQQTLQQRLSPRQIQFIKLLQLPTASLEQRMEEELENNPLLEESVIETGTDEEIISDNRNDDTAEVDDNEEIEWETFISNTYSEGSHPPGYTSDEPWQEIPRPYHSTLLESLESQMTLLDLDESKQLIADQILGSIDEDGYLRRDLKAIADSVTFHSGQNVSLEEAEEVLNIIQRLDPPGIGARNLRECLAVQLELCDKNTKGREVALRMLKNEWDLFEKKHFDKLKKKLHVTDEELKAAFHCIKLLDPKPGNLDEEIETGTGTENYIIPDFNVVFQPSAEEENGSDVENGEFIITLNEKNAPRLRISPKYLDIWKSIQSGKSDADKTDPETRSFIKDKIESAQWFIDALRQRQNTLLSVMQTIVALQEDFFTYGGELKPMILKDVASRIEMDISTVSRVVNGKFVQTPFGVFSLKYFFNEALITRDGREVSSRTVKTLIQDIVEHEDPLKPLSDEAITRKLQEKGYDIARRTVSKYREKLNIPVARLRKNLE